MSHACSGFVLDVAVGVHEHRDRLVALVGLGLGLVHLLVDRQLAPGEVAVVAEDLVPDLVAVRALDHARRGDGARVDHRVHLGALVLLDRDDRVEHLAGRVDAHVVDDRLRSPDSSITLAIVKTLEIDWIDTSEVTSPVGVDLAVDRHQRDAEDVRVDLGERRDVVGVGPFLEVLVLCIGRLEGGVDVGRRLRQDRNGRQSRAWRTPAVRPSRLRCGYASSRLASNQCREVGLDGELEAQVVHAPAVGEVLTLAPLHLAADHEVLDRVYIAG